MSKPITIITCDTAHFSFIATGESPAHAEAVLRRAIEKHNAQYHAKLDLEDLGHNGDVRVLSGHVGQAFRDFEPLC